jgi:hypothetical protein
MVRSGDTTLGEIPSNGAEGGQARKSSGSGNSLKGIKPKSHRFDDDVLPSSRITRIEVTQDWEGSATDSRHIKRTSSSHSTNIGRGDRYIPNRDLSRSASLGADHLRDSIGGEALSSGSTSARASSPADNNITSSSNSLDDGEEQENRGPSDLGEALQMERCHQILSFNAPLLQKFEVDML